MKEQRQIFFVLDDAFEGGDLFLGGHGIAHRDIEIAHAARLDLEPFLLCPFFRHTQIEDCGEAELGQAAIGAIADFTA